VGVDGIEPPAAGR